MLAVDLALAGIGGIAESPEDVYAGCFRGETDAGELAAALGEEWAVCDGYHKLYACCQYAHASLDALGEIFSRRPELKGGKGVASIVVETDPRGITLENYAPATTLAAKFSLPHAVASTLVHGSSGVEAFTSETLRDPRVSSLRNRVQMKPHPGVKPWPLDRPGRVTLVLESGEQVAAESASARGGPDRPFADEEIDRKIAALSAGTAPGLSRNLSRLLSSEEPFAAWMASIFQ
jgi:2-methylcitrate dehydratase PrpD